MKIELDGNRIELQGYYAFKDFTQYSLHPGAVMNVLDSVNRLETDVINLLLKQLLNRDPIEDDYRRLCKTFETGSIDYELFFRGIKLGKMVFGFPEDKALRLAGGTPRFHVRFYPGDSCPDYPEQPGECWPTETIIHEDGSITILSPPQ